MRGPSENEKKIQQKTMWGIKDNFKLNLNIVQFFKISKFLETGQKSECLHTGYQTEEFF